MAQEKTKSAKENSGKVNVALTVTLLRVVFGIALCLSGPLFSLPATYSLIMMIAGGLIAGVELLIAGVSGFLHEDYFNRNTILLIVFIVSYIIGVGYEGSLLLILTQIGLIVSDYVRKVARDHILSLTGLDFKSAHVFRGGLLVDNFLTEVISGDEIMVHAGEYFPVDCVVIEGNTTARTHLIDAKSSEFAVNIGDTVLAGTMNVGTDVRCEVISEGRSTATDILEVLRRPETNHVPAIAQYFQPIMMAFSVLVGVLLVVLTEVDAYEAVHRVLAIITLSSVIPAYAGIGDFRFAARAGAASRGAVFASDEVFTELGKCEKAVFCADGILTDGKLRVSAAYSDTLDEDTFLRVAAHAMAYANDPAAEAIMNAYEGDIVFEHIQDFREIPNCGVMTVYNGVPVVLGTQALMANVKGLLPKKMSADRQMMFMLVGKQYAGYLVLTDPINDLTDSISENMMGYGIDHLSFVTSYSSETAQKISDRSGISEFESGFSCDERMQFIEQLSDATEGKLAYFFCEKYAGEEHSAADYDISIGGSTLDLITWKSDVVAPTGRVSAIFDGIETAISAQQMSDASVCCMFLVKLLLIILAGSGLVTVWFVAAFELIASLFAKVLSTGAYNENVIKRFYKKVNKKKA